MVFYVLIFRINFQTSFIIFSSGFNFRRSRSKPINYTAQQKLNRYFWALNFDFDLLSKLLFADESAMLTNRFGYYHNRKPSSRPSASSIKPRNVVTVNMWLGISYYGATELCVSRKKYTISSIFIFKYFILRLLVII
jgi:hypothetical protein